MWKASAFRALTVSTNLGMSTSDSSGFVGVSTWRLRFRCVRLFFGNVQRRFKIAFYFNYCIFWLRTLNVFVFGVCGFRAQIIPVFSRISAQTSGERFLRFGRGRRLFWFQKGTLEKEKERLKEQEETTVTMLLLVLGFHRFFLLSLLFCFAFWVLSKF